MGGLTGVMMMKELKEIDEYKTYGGISGADYE